MFSGYWDSNKTNIEEANKHLQALMSRINELEKTNKEQTSALYRKDEETRMQLLSLEEEKNKDILRLRNELRHVESENSKLKDMCCEKDLQITKLHKSYVVLNDIVKFKPILDKLSFHLGQAENVDDPNVKHSPINLTEFLEINGDDDNNAAANNVAMPTVNNTSPKNVPIQHVKHSKPVKQLKQNLAKNLLLNTSYALSDEEEGKVADESVLYNSSGGKELYL
ncbi:uncharacterized protein LOC141899535 [Tubulanus polymorphus]|uniref:uncharacterized protein LOC141899535 n=1 Tax=Tubulanus polymorphus TaxID=672921 RepID=UPI003DA5F9B1